MRLSYLCLFVVVITCEALPIEEEWEQWKEQHAKSYLNGKEEFQKKVTWAKNADFIEEFNQQGHSYTLAMNHFTDVVSVYKLQFSICCYHETATHVQSPEDFQDSLMDNIDLNQLRYGASSTYGNSSRCDDDCVTLDWRNEGFTPEVLWE